MREYRHHTVRKLTACTCDRCGRRLVPDDGEWQERLSFDHSCGFDSVFGDGNTVGLDLCQHCVREVLGQWLRITPPEHERETHALIEHVNASTKEASAALDDALLSVAQSNRRIATMAEALASMPNVGEDADFSRRPLTGALKKFAAFGADVMAEGQGRYERAKKGKASRRLGWLKGQVWVKHSFDAPLAIVDAKKPKKRKKQP
ncbi:hypothetical protein [Ralstonia pseudosolanacearum]|uniref:hypothetical protein n=1 Tax=Ralstonia pseudosolanacearum TaxID=1310165 RepID=UPI003C2C66E9